MFSALSRLAAPPVALAPPERLFSIWEITSWILPMAPEHFRRVLAESPDLPQGSSGAEGGTRWFSAADLAVLRRHFTARARAGRYRPPRPEGVRAPILTMAGPQGGSGRSTALLHLATAAALNGWRVLVIDADPGGQLAPRLGPHLGPRLGLREADRFRGETSPAPLDGALALIARAAARHLRRMNATRLDLGEPPLAVDDRLSAALALEVADLIQPTAWPGLEVMAAGPLALLADPLITAWRLAQRSWQPWTALAEAVDEAGLRQRYDLIFCDTGRGLGSLALAALASADVLLAPLPLRDDGPEALGRGFQALSGAFDDLQAEAQTLARALGRSAPAFGWRRLAVLPTRAGPDAASRLAGFAAKLAGASEVRLLPDALPEIATLAEGQESQLYDLDYRRLGRLAYGPLREATEAAFRGLAGLVGEIWQEDRQTDRLI